jgi:hypothetical protein
MPMVQFNNLSLKEQKNRRNSYGQQIAAKSERTLRRSRALGFADEEVMLEWLAKRAEKKRPKLTEEERRAVWERLLQDAGAENLGYATGADNESIDDDLAREYGSTHEEDG